MINKFRLTTAFCWTIPIHLLVVELPAVLLAMFFQRCSVCCSIQKKTRLITSYSNINTFAWTISKICEWIIRQNQAGQSVSWTRLQLEKCSICHTHHAVVFFHFPINLTNSNDSQSRWNSNALCTKQRVCLLHDDA